MKFFIHNNNHVAMIPKAGSSAIARAILFAIKPNYVVRSVSNDQAKVEASLNKPKWQALIQKTDAPVNPIVPVRDPVERFRSACAQEGKTAEEALTKCEAGDFSGHFKPVTTWLITESRIYKFPEHIDDIATALGLDGIPSVNDSETNNGPKPDLTESELARVQAIYADDIALFDSITDAGQVWVYPPTLATDEDKAAKVTELEAARYEAEVAGTTVAALGGAFVRTDKETQNELGKALALLTITPTFEIDWKFPDGTIVHLAKAQIDAVAGAVFTHVQSTRTTFKDKAALVAAATTQAELDAITW